VHDAQEFDHGGRLVTVLLAAFANPRNE
jgi:hypothetical protein